MRGLIFIFYFISKICVFQKHWATKTFKSRYNETIIVCYYMGCRNRALYFMHHRTDFRVKTLKIISNNISFLSNRELRIKEHYTYKLLSGVSKYKFKMTLQQPFINSESIDTACSCVLLLRMSSSHSKINFQHLQILFSYFLKCI